MINIDNSKYTRFVSLQPQTLQEPLPDFRSTADDVFYTHLGGSADDKKAKAYDDLKNMQANLSSALIRDQWEMFHITLKDHWGSRLTREKMLDLFISLNREGAEDLVEQFVISAIRYLPSVLDIVRESYSKDFFRQHLLETLKDCDGVILTLPVWMFELLSEDEMYQLFNRYGNCFYFNQPINGMVQYINAHQTVKEYVIDQLRRNEDAIYLAKRYGLQEYDIQQPAWSQDFDKLVRSFRRGKKLEEVQQLQNQMSILTIRRFCQDLKYDMCELDIDGETAFARFQVLDWTAAPDLLEVVVIASLSHETYRKIIEAVRDRFSESFFREHFNKHLNRDMVEILQWPEWLVLLASEEKIRRGIQLSVAHIFKNSPNSTPYTAEELSSLSRYIQNNPSIKAYVLELADTPAKQEKIQELLAIAQI